MAAPALPADVQKLLVDQAPSVQSRTNYFDPSVFASRHGRPYSSRKIPIETLMEMRTDAIMRFAQLVALVSIFTSKWKIECANARKASFIDNALRRIIGRLIIQYFECWNFGWQSLVKEFGLMNPGWQYIDPKTGKAAPVWDEGGYPALVWEPFVTLRPQSVAPVWAANGSFNGIAIAKSGVQGGYALPVVPFDPGDVIGIDHPIDISSFFNDQDQAKTKVDLDHSLWVTNERDAQFGSVWGYPRLGYAYKYWWAYEMTFGILQRAVERHGDPSIVVSYPMGSSMLNGKEVDNQVIAFMIAERARSGSVLAVPSEVWGEDMATANQAAKWKIEYLKPDADFDKLVRVLEYYDTMRFRSMMVSELAIAEGSGGTSSRNVAAETGQRTAESQIFAQAELDELINRYMIPQLGDANFPELKDEPARKVTQAFGQDEAQLAADMLRSYANSNVEKLPIDKPQLMRQFQVPTLEGAELDRWQKDLAKAAEQTKPDPQEAKPNGPAGVTDTGFYYQAPERIQLAEDETFLAALPKSKHYSDRAVLAQTRLIRKLWHDTLTKQYNDFADHVAKADVALADEDPAGSAAEKIIAGWKFAYTGVVKKMAVALAKVLARAGRLELGSSRLKADAWDPDSKSVAEWVRDNAAAAIRSIDETTRNQLRTFLANQLVAGNSSNVIADKMREHFADFPAKRADLIAREETKRYYNAGTLFAAEAAGSAQVQALDAQGPGPTDPDCEARNGRLFSITDAWAESEKEHVRGTLSWRIVPGEIPLSLSWSSRSEMGPIAARFDPDRRVITRVEGIRPEVEGKYLEQLVSWFISSA